MSEQDSALSTLTHITKAVTQDSASVNAVRIEDPTSAIEVSLTEFAQDSFNQVREDRKFRDAVKDAILTRLSEANIKQLMDFYREVQEGETGATAILVNPITALQTAKVTAEIETHQSPAFQHIEEKVIKNASKDVLQGIVQLNQILEAINANKVTPTTVVDEKPVKE